MIIKWRVKCDECGKIIDAIKETFRETDNGQFCEECYQKTGGQ